MVQRGTLVRGILRRARLGAVALLSLVAACGGGERSPVEVLHEGLEHALPDEALGPSPPVEGPLAADPLLRDPAHGAMSVAPFALSATTTWRLEAGSSEADGTRRRVIVTDDVKFTQRKDGAFRSTLERRVADPPAPDRVVGSEAVYVDRRFFVRDRYGDFVEHNPMRELHVPWRRRALDVLPTLVRLLGPALARSQGAPTSRDGVVLERTALSLAPGDHAVGPPSAALRDDLATWDQWWRGAHTPTALRGEALVDPRCGCVVGARLDVTLKGEAEGRPFTLRIDHQLSLTPLAVEPAIAQPDHATEPRRRRVQHLLREVLGDLLVEPGPDAAP